MCKALPGFGLFSSTIKTKQKERKESGQNKSTPPSADFCYYQVKLLKPELKTKPPGQDLNMVQISI